MARTTTIYILVNNLSTFQVAKNNFKDGKLYFNAHEKIPLHAAVNIVISCFSGQFSWDCWNTAFKVLEKKNLLNIIWITYNGVPLILLNMIEISKFTRNDWILKHALLLKTIFTLL